jgi:hypothetical protein
VGEVSRDGVGDQQVRCVGVFTDLTVFDCEAGAA